MKIVNMQTVEDLRPLAYDLGAIPDIDARVFQVEVGDSLALTILHRLDRTPEMVYPVLIEGNTNVWITGITNTEFVVNRSADVAVRLLAV